MIRLFKFLATAVRGYYDTFSPLGKFWLTLGIAALIVDAAISFKYGISQSTLHGLGFALVAIFFALVPDQAYTEIEKRRYASGITLGLLCVPIGVIAYYSHLGYGASLRVGSIQQTGVSNAKFEDKVDNTKKLNDKIAFLEQRRANLDAEMNALVGTKVGGWAVTVRPSSAAELQGAIDAKTLERDQEAKRGGCKGRCLARQQELGHLQALQAKAKEIETNESQHVATLNALASARTEVAATEYTSDSVTNQTNVAAQIYLAFTGEDPAKAIKPDTVVASFVNLFIAGGGALAFMLMAPIGFFIAGRNRLPESAMPARHRAMTETRAKIEDRYEEIRAGEKPNAGNSNYFVRVEGKAEDALAKLAEILRNSNMRTA
jgi:hypothetical protein